MNPVVELQRGARPVLSARHENAVDMETLVMVWRLELR